MSPPGMMLHNETLPNCPLARRERTIAGTPGRSGREGKMILGNVGVFSVLRFPGGVAL